VTAKVGRFLSADFLSAILHGRNRAFLGDRLYKSSAVAEMGDRGHNRYGPKGGGAVPVSQGATGSPSNIMWSGLRSPSVPSGIFIHILVSMTFMCILELSL